MDDTKIKILIYILLLTVAIGLLYTSVENMKTNKELVELIKFCDAYSDNDWDKIDEVCGNKVVTKYVIKKDSIGSHYNISITP